jgi:glucokinase
VLAVDVGGTAIKVARVDAAGRLLAARESPTPVPAGPAAVVSAVRAAARELAGPDIAAAGVVVPGVVDVAAGVARYAANLGWRDVPLARLLGDDLGVSVAVDHDVRAAGAAERTFGLAREATDCLVVVIGTGIAGVVVAGGRHLRGASDLAGEIGHVPAYPDGELCACGQRGCVETYASAAAVARRYAARTGEPVTAAQVVARLAADPEASRVWDEAAAALGVGLAGYTMLLDPALIVLSGGLAGAGTVLRDPVRAALAGRLAWRPAPAVEVSPLAGRAGLFGAALLAWQAAGVQVGAELGADWRP